MTENIVNIEQISCTNAALATLSEQFPELTELKAPELLQATESLVSEFGIRPEFFEGDKGLAHTFLLASIASNLVKLETEGKNTRENFREFATIADATAFVALDYLTGFDELAAESKHEADSPLSDSAQEAVIMKYKSEELTAAVQERVGGGMLDAVKNRLGITEATEEPYELIVLSIAHQDDGITSGIDLESGVSYPDQTEWESDFEAARNKAVKTEADKLINSDWSEGLVNRRAQFYKEMGKKPTGAPAFVTHLNGKTYLCVTADTAELLAYDQVPDQRSRYYDNNDHKQNITLLEHEYTHTQGATVLENLVGVTLEEQRAEWFSGMKLGYRDVKTFFQDLRLMTGCSVTELLEGRVKGGKPEEIYGDIATQIGLDKLYKIIMTFPQNYVVEQSSALLRGLQESIGGYEGIISDMLQEAQVAGNMAEVHQRAAELANKVRSINPGYLETWLNSRTQYSKVGTELISQQADSIIT